MTRPQLAPATLPLSNPKYRPEIDGLRALAILPVILFHAGSQVFSGGFVGVDVFFVISGYLITTIILAERETGTFSLLNFYERRARRILPALFFVMLTCLPFALIWLIPKDIMEFSQSLITVPVFASNILFLNQSGYFDTSAELKPLLHTWSLAVEEQYYLLFPLFILLTWKLGKRRVVSLLLILAAISLAFAHWASYNKPEVAFFLLPSRGWELAIGALIGFYFAGKRKIILASSVRQVLSCIGVFLIFYAVFAFSKSTPFPGLYALVPTVGTALIILFATPDTLVGKVLSSRVFVGIGLISYSAYLWHQPLFAFARHRVLPEPTEALLLSLSIFSMVLAYFSWRFVEKPFRNRDLISRNRLIFLAIFFSTFFISIGLWGHFSNGAAAIRFNTIQNRVLMTATKSPKRNECHTRGNDYLKPKNSCKYQTGNTSWAVIGDSHGIELAYALSEILKLRDDGISHFTFSGCGPALNRISERVGCSHWTHEVVEHIENDTAIRNVVLAYSMEWGDDSDEYWKSYVSIVRRFIEADKNVIVVLQAPRLPRHIQYYIGQEIEDFNFVSVTSKSQSIERSSFIRSRLSDLPPKTKIIDPSDLFCNAMNCAAILDEKALYYDSHHMSVDGGLIIAAEMLK